MFGSEIRTQDTLIRYTMSKSVAEKIKNRFIEMSTDGESPSYLDCVVFDEALSILGEFQQYYGYTDAEMEEVRKAQRVADETFGAVKVIDITDTWKEVLS